MEIGSVFFFFKPLALVNFKSWFLSRGSRLREVVAQERLTLSFKRPTYTIRASKTSSDNGRYFNWRQSISMTNKTKNKTFHVTCLLQRESMVVTQSRHQRQQNRL